MRVRPTASGVETLPILILILNQSAYGHSASINYYYIERVKPRLTYFLWRFSRVASYPYPVAVAKLAAATG